MSSLTKTTVEEIDVSTTFKTQFLNSLVINKFSRLWMTTLLLITDLVSLLLAGSIAVIIRYGLGDRFQSANFYIRMIPLLLLVIVIYILRGLYPAVGLSPVEELRRLTSSTSVAFLIATGFTFWVRTAEDYSRIVFALAWLLSLVLVQFNRWLMRIIAVQLGVWGEPVAIVGYGPQGKRIVEFLLKNLRLGLKPVVIIDGFDNADNKDHSIPKLRIGDPDKINGYLNDAGIRSAILITSEMPDYLQEAIVVKQRFGFKRLILITDLKQVGSIGVKAHDLEGFLGLEVRQNLLNFWHRVGKRLIDLIVVIVVGIFSIPIMLLIALLIYLDSPGGILYNQLRIGHMGRRFGMWKFRTMVEDADQILEKYLQENPLARLEWDKTQKLKNDPRVTRLGYFLRKWSLDELPQLYNILIGDMSLVGPRPFFPEQYTMYGKSYHLYIKVRPGVTGMWQVSGRNGTTFSERAQWDEYYVRNWSIWLDLYILLRTIWVVIKRDGAY